MAVSPACSDSAATSRSSRLERTLGLPSSIDTLGCLPMSVGSYHSGCGPVHGRRLRGAFAFAELALDDQLGDVVDPQAPIHRSPLHEPVRFGFPEPLVHQDTLGALDQLPGLETVGELGHLALQACDLSVALDRNLPVERFSDDLEALFLEHLAKVHSDDGLVLRDDDARRHDAGSRFHLRYSSSIAASAFIVVFSDPEMKRSTWRPTIGILTRMSASTMRVVESPSGTNA